MRSPTWSPEQPGQLLDDTDQLVARRKRWLWAAGDVRSGAQLGIGERHASRQDPYTNFALTRFRNVILHHLHDLRATVVINNHTFHLKFSSGVAGM